MTTVDVLFGARGDVGGFGISGDSDFQTGSGTDEFKYDVLMQGPFLGVEYSF